MARKKVKKSGICSWEELDNALHSIINCQSSIDEINAELNREISTLKQIADESAAKHRELIKALEAEIKIFVTQHREELDGKTKKLNFGQTGFRQSTSLVVPTTNTADIINYLKLNNMTDCVKVVETINKDVMKTYPTDKVLAAGAYYKTSNKFWYETEKNNIKTD